MNRQIAKIVYDAICSAQAGLNVTYGYPEEFNPLPTVSYMDGNYGSAQRTMDEQIRSYEVNYLISIWSKSASDNIDLADKIAASLKEAGFVVSSLGHIVEPASGLYHMRLTADSHWDRYENKLY